MTKLYSAVLILLFVSFKLSAQSTVDFLDKPYSSVVFLTTHNAYNNAFEGFTIPNQNNPICNFSTF